MLYMHFCKNCNFLHILTGHQTTCPGCKSPLTELNISYETYYDMNLAARNELMKKCNDPEELKKITFVYKRRRYNKGSKKECSM